MKSLTVVVMTYNRYPRLRRLLQYAAQTEPPLTILVLDSSGDPVASSEVAQWAGQRPVSHVTCLSSMSPIEKMSEGLQRVATPYTVLWDDDDFLVPGALEEAVRFLEAHPDYESVVGRGALFVVEQRHGRSVVSCLPYPARELTDATACARLRRYLPQATPLNRAVHRTDGLRRVVAHCRARQFGYIWGELALGSLSTTYGKVKRLDRLCLLKERHAQQDAWSDHGRRLDVYDWVTDPRFANVYGAFRECLTEELMRIDGVSAREAREVVKDAFWGYLARVLSGKWPGDVRADRQTTGQQLRRIARRLPGVQAVWGASQWLMPPRPHVMSLPALLHPASLHRRDFLPMYHAILSAAADEQESNAR